MSSFVESPLPPLNFSPLARTQRINLKVKIFSKPLLIQSKKRKWHPLIDTEKVNNPNFFSFQTLKVGRLRQSRSTLRHQRLVSSWSKTECTFLCLGDLRNIILIDLGLRLQEKRAGNKRQLDLIRTPLDQAVQKQNLSGNQICQCSSSRKDHHKIQKAKQVTCKSSY